MNNEEIGSMETEPRLFPETLWSVVLKATESKAGLDALTVLCERYRTPLMVCIRQHSSFGNEAEDLFHEFLEKKVLAGGFFRNLSPAKGRFRTHLVKSLRNFLNDVRDKRNARKRQSFEQALRLDSDDGDNQRARETPDPKCANFEFELDRAWARRVVDLALDRLHKEAITEGKEAVFQAVQSSFGERSSDGNYAALAARMNRSEGSTRVAVHRMRARLGNLISAEIKQTVSNEADWREELKYLLSLF